MQTDRGSAMKPGLLTTYRQTDYVTVLDNHGFTIHTQVQGSSDSRRHRRLGRPRQFPPMFCFSFSTA